MKITKSIVLGLAILCCCGLLAGQEKKLSESEVPEAVLHAFAKTYPNAKVRNWDKEIRDGKVLYEAEGVTDGNVTRSIMYSPDGKVVLIKETMAVADLPASITGMVSKQFPGAVIQAAQKRTHDETVEYVLLLEGVATKRIVVDSSGKITSK
jgi:hypothetical protein